MFGNVHNCPIFAHTKTTQNMKNATNLKSLFVEVVKASLSQNVKNSANMVANTIQHFAEMKPFNTISIEQWYSICSANGVKFSI
jgi:hypothetical protein